MARPPKLERIRDYFVGRIGAAEKLVWAARQLAAVRGAGTGGTLHVEHVGQVVELAFMGICAQWETFLEDSMVRYLAGAVPSAGTAPRLRMAKCSDLPHAYQLLSGKPRFDSAKDFLSWTNPTTVIDRAKVFLVGGEPYSAAITPCIDELRRTFQLRNRIAHASTKSINDFKDAANFYLAPKAMRPGYRVADLLGEPHTKCFTFLSAAPAGTTRDYFAAHAEMFRHLARKIVP